MSAAAELELETPMPSLTAAEREKIARRAELELKAAKRLLERQVPDERVPRVRAVVYRSAITMLRYSDVESRRELAERELDALDRERLTRQSADVLRVLREVLPARAAHEITDALLARVVHELMRRRPTREVVRP